MKVAPKAVTAGLVMSMQSSQVSREIFEDRSNLTAAKQGARWGIEATAWGHLKDIVAEAEADTIDFEFAVEIMWAGGTEDVSHKFAKLLFS